VDWEDLDRVVGVDHLTSLWIPELAAPVARELARLDELVTLLRERCPWDRDQTHESLERYLLEETYEVIDAIRSGDPGHLEEELGDLLFQVVFHARIATQEGHFTLADVARGIHDKLETRHPHVFSDSPTPEVDELRRQWEARKRHEKGRASAMDGIPESLPALLYAEHVRRRAGRAGLDVSGLDAIEAAALDAEASLRAEVDRFVDQVRAAGH